MSVQFLGLQGGGGFAVPFERRGAPYYLTSAASNPQDALRLKRYEEHWRFYQGLQWSFQREDGEPLVTANYCRAIVDKKASWLVGKGMTISVPQALQEVTKPTLDEVWRYNNEKVFLFNMATTGGVTGDVFVLVTYEEPKVIQKRINPYTRGKIRLRLLGSHQVFPQWNPLNQEELIMVRIVTEVIDNTPVAPGDNRRTPMSEGGMGVNRKRRYIEDIYPDKILEYWEDHGDRTERVNSLGEIPLVHISNQSFPGEYFGLSDLDGLIDIQSEYNQKLTDVSDIVHYNAAPTVVITGAKAKNLERGAKAMWSGLPDNAKVFTLQMTGDLVASHSYLNTVRTIMLDLSGVPEWTLGRETAVSNSSAATLEVMFQPLVEATARKSPNYALGIEQINYFILRYDQLVSGRTYPVDICKCCGGRIVETLTKNYKGELIPRRKCFLIDPQTLDFLTPEQVEVNWRRKYSFGSETRMMPFAQVKAEYLKQSASYWDPAPEKDLQEEAEIADERAKGVEAHVAGQQQKAATHEAAGNAQVGPDGKVLPAKPAPTMEPIPGHLRPEPEAKPEPLAPHDIDVPEEPEKINVISMTWDPNQQQYVKEQLGELLLTPSGCKRPTYLSPYETEVCFRSALPRDRSNDANLFGMYQTNGWRSRHWCMTRIEDDEVNLEEMDKQIADDVPFILALQGKPDASGVAQTAGVQGQGTNNGAPPPPVPGPGRGNMYSAGDNLAGKGPGVPSVPANPSPGSGV